MYAAIVEQYSKAIDLDRGSVISPDGHLERSHAYKIKTNRFENIDSILH